MPKKKNTTKTYAENEEGTNESFAKKKKDLETQIAELHTLVLDIQSNLGIHKFGQIQSRSKKLDLPEISKNSIKKAINLQQKSVYDMYRFAGFYCTKLTDTGYVFNFASSAKNELSTSYCVEILTENMNLVRLGKWIMPFSANMDKVLEETPLKEVLDISRFLKNCKQYVETFENRKRQYHNFKNLLEDARNCILDSGWGYTRINLQLFGVCEKKTNISRNLFITFLYNSKGTKPRKILIETLAAEKLRDQEIKSIKSFLSPFHKYELGKAFEMIDQNHPSISWTVRTSATDIAELRISSSENEEDSFFSQIQRTRRSKTQVKEKKRRILKKIDDKKRKKVERNKTKENASMSSVSKNSIKLQETLVPEGNDDGSLIGHTPNSMLKPKLRQTKLNFEVTKGSPTLSLDRTFVKPKESIATSTPLRRRVKFNLRMEGLDVSDVTKLTSGTEKRVKNFSIVLNKLEEENENKTSNDGEGNSMKISTKSFYKNKPIRRSPRKNEESPKTTSAKIIHETAIPRLRINLKRAASEETKEIPSKIPQLDIKKYQRNIQNMKERKKPRVIREEILRKRVFQRFSSQSPTAKSKKTH